MNARLLCKLISVLCLLNFPVSVLAESSEALYSCPNHTMSIAIARLNMIKINSMPSLNRNKPENKFREDPIDFTLSMLEKDFTHSSLGERELQKCLGQITINKPHCYIFDSKTPGKEDWANGNLGGEIVNKTFTRHEGPRLYRPSFDSALRRLSLIHI